MNSVIPLRTVDCDNFVYINARDYIKSYTSSDIVFWIPTKADRRESRIIVASCKPEPTIMMNESCMGAELP